jgi:hypothetical protein
MWHENADKACSGQTPVAGVKDMGSQVIHLPQGEDACAQKPPREADCNGAHPSIAHPDLGAPQNILLSKLPCIRTRICIPPGPDALGTRRDNPVDNAFLLPRRDEDDHVSLPQFFDTTRDEADTVPRSKEGLHALSPAEDFVDVFLFRSGHAVFHPLVSC